MMCIVGACPAIYETDRGTILLVGARLDPKDVEAFLAGKVAPHEEVIEIPKELISRLKT